MARRLPPHAIVAFACLHGASALAASGGSAGAGGADPDDVRRARGSTVHGPHGDSLSPTDAARALAGLSGPSAPSGGGSTAPLTVLHAFDFWQESESLEFGSRTRDALCVDLDADGLPELVRLGIAMGDPHGGSFGITRGGPYGPAGAELGVVLLPSPRSVRAADLNGDGRMDLLAVHLRPVPGSPNMFVRCVRLFLQAAPTPGASGGPQFLDPAPSVDLAPGGEMVLVADVDGDQLDDLVSVGVGHELYYQKGLGLLPGNPAVPQFAAQAVSISKLAAQAAGLPPGSAYSFGLASDLAAGDFDADGTADLAVAAGSALGGGLHLFFQRATGWAYQGFGLATPGQGPVAYASLTTGDFDGDGCLDLVATSPMRDLCTFLNARAVSGAVDRSGASGMTAVPSAGLGLSAQQVVSGDFDGDGRADVAFFDPLTERVQVCFHAAGAAAPGAFSPAPAHGASFAVRGSGLCALDAVDADGDGDLDLVGSYLLSQSTSVLSNERLANSRKSVGVLRLFGSPGPLTTAPTFVPDGVEFLQRPGASPTPAVALDRFTFRAQASPGQPLRVRARLHGLRPGVRVRLGLLDTESGSLRWVLGGPVGTESQELLFLAPEARRFVSVLGEVQVFLMSDAGGADFGLAVDQLSAEVLH